MQNSNQGFAFSLQILHIDSIKPRQSGTSVIDNQEIVWGHAVKFKVRNIDLVPDEDFGEKELESTYEIEIPCDSMSETVSLNNFLKDIKKKGEPFPISVTLPSKNSGEFSSKSSLKGREFMDSFKK